MNDENQCSILQIVYSASLKYSMTSGFHLFWIKIVRKCKKKILYIIVYTHTIKIKFNGKYCKNDDGSVISNYEPLKTASRGVVVACSLRFRIHLQGKTKGGLLF